MPIEKFRSIDEMKSPQISTNLETIVEKVEFVWSMAEATNRGVQRGVQKFRSMSEANSARQEFVEDRARGCGFPL